MLFLVAGSAAPAVVDAAEAGWAEREAAAVAAAEAGRLGDALAMLDELCASAPQRASSFNNRAQVKRLQKNDEGAKADLDSAIRLAGGWLDTNYRSAGQEAVLKQRNVLKQAHTQRAIYHQ
jgi:hypothetical protein